MPLFDDPRSTWTTEVSTNPVPVKPNTRSEFMVHWNGPRLGITRASDHQRCLNTVRAIRAYHVNTNGWSDIGYNGFVCPHGRTIEGRGIDLQGAHCPDHNILAYGIQALVGEGDVPLDVNALNRLRLLYDSCCDRSVRLLTRLGHRDGAATECPGETLYDWVGAGMPYQQEESGGAMSQAQYDAIMAAIADVKSDLAEHNTTALSEMDQIDADLASAVSQTGIEHKGIFDRLDGLAAEVTEAVTAAIGPAVQEAIDQSLGGIEVEARYVRQSKEETE